MRKSNEKVVRKSRARDSFFAKYYPYPVDHDRYEYRVVYRGARRIEVRPKHSPKGLIGCDIGPAMVISGDMDSSCICYCKDISSVEPTAFYRINSIDINMKYTRGGECKYLFKQYSGVLHNTTGPAIKNSTVKGCDFEHDSFCIRGERFFDIDAYLKQCEATNEEKLILKIQYDGLDLS